MLLDFLYSLPAALGALIIVGGIVAASVAGLLLTHRLVPHALRRSHNDVAGVMIAVVGVVYAVLLAFIAVAVWQDYDDADAIVHREASLAGDIHQDALNMKPPAGPRLRELVRRYVGIVITEEWPAMRSGGESPRAAATLDELQNAVFTFPYRGPVFDDVLQRVNALADARRDRLINGNSGLQPVAWFVLLAGSALTIAFCFLFGVPDLRVHAVMTALVAASIALVLFLIVSFDYPFRGAVSITPEAFRNVLAAIDAQEAAQPPAPVATPDDAAASPSPRP
jgi:phosphate/sulfate permease